MKSDFQPFDAAASSFCSVNYLEQLWVQEVSIETIHYTNLCTLIAKLKLWFTRNYGMSILLCI
jgi:hypothetical protein